VLTSVGAQDHQVDEGQPGGSCGDQQASGGAHGQGRHRAHEGGLACGSGEGRGGQGGSGFRVWALGFRAAALKLMRVDLPAQGGGEQGARGCVIGREATL